MKILVTLALETEFAPFFDKKFLRWLVDQPAALFGFGIPPVQYDLLAADDRQGITGALKSRLEKLACDFDLQDNYFAWQAFGRGYDIENREAVPDYLKAENYAALKARVHSVRVRHASLLDFLKEQPAQSLDRFVLLDAQDWMTAEQLSALWTEIDRTADNSDARVIFRTAGTETPLPRKLPVCVRPLCRWPESGVRRVGPQRLPSRFQRRFHKLRSESGVLRASRRGSAEMCPGRRRV